ncbi:unnamed protein product [Caenorhabditis sp. 36 PRJEB53466]|nr:unnamed protein product [Caenorhabditis sp. 36 PRJEB53466]
MLSVTRRLFSLSAAMASVHGFTVKNASGEDVALSKYQGKVLIIVNVASQCGLTNSNYNQFKELLDVYKKDGLEVLAFRATSLAVRSRLRAGFVPKNRRERRFGRPALQVPEAGKGGFLVDAIKWNFTKFLVGRDGHVIKRFSPTTEPKDMKKDIEAALQAKL